MSLALNRYRNAGNTLHPSGYAGASPDSSTAGAPASASNAQPGGNIVTTPNAPLPAGGAAGMRWFWPVLVAGVGAFVVYDYSKGKITFSSPAKN